MRLTEKRKEIYSEFDKTSNEIKTYEGLEYYFLKDEKKGLALQKIGQLEDIEEELGVDIYLYLRMTTGTTVFTKHEDLKDIKGYKQLKNGILEQMFEVYSYNVRHKCFCFKVLGATRPIYYLKDYGKTWALTREELEWKEQDNKIKC